MNSCLALSDPVFIPGCVLNSGSRRKTVQFPGSLNATALGRAIRGHMHTLYPRSDTLSNASLSYHTMLTLTLELFILRSADTESGYSITLTNLTLTLHTHTRTTHSHSHCYLASCVCSVLGDLTTGLLSPGFTSNLCYLILFILSDIWPESL